MEWEFHGILIPKAQLLWTSVTLFAESGFSHLPQQVTCSITGRIDIHELFAHDHQQQIFWGVCMEASGVASTSEVGVDLTTAGSAFFSHIKGLDKSGLGGLGGAGGDRWLFSYRGIMFEHLIDWHVMSLPSPSIIVNTSCLFRPDRADKTLMQVNYVGCLGRIFIWSWACRELPMKTLQQNHTVYYPTNPKPFLFDLWRQNMKNIEKYAVLTETAQREMPQVDWNGNGEFYKPLWRTP